MIKKILLLIISFFSFVYVDASIQHNILTVEESPKNTWINWITIKDSIMVVNLSANNMVNDTLFAGWINIDPNTYIEVNNLQQTMIGVDGIATAPLITKYDYANQTITFNLIFPCIKNTNASFNLVENDSSDWKFKRIKLYPYKNDESDTYYAPHKFSKLIISQSDSLMQKGEFENVIEINKDIMSFVLQNEIKADVLLATTAYYLAGCNNQLKNDSLTQYYSKYVINLYESNKWEEDTALSRMYGVLGDMFARKGNYNEAIKQAEKALIIKNKLYPNGAEDLALSYGKLSLYYERIGDYDNAINLAEKGLMIRERINDNNKSPVVINLCRYYYIKKRYADALELALAYKNEEIKNESIETYINLCAVCSHSYYNMGNMENAKRCAEEGYNLLTQNSYNDNSKIMNFLGFLPLEEKIEIQKKYIQSAIKDEFYVSIMQNLAVDYFEVGNYNEAIKIQELCNSIREKFEIHDKAKECEGQNRLLSYYFFSGKIEEYTQNIEQCKKRTEALFGRYSLEYADVLKINCLHLYEKNLYYDTLIELNKMLDIYKILIIHDFSLLTYDDRELLWRYYYEWFDEIFLNCYLQALDTNPEKAGEINGLLYDNILFSKGLLLNSQIANNAHKKMREKLEGRILNSNLVTNVLNNNLYGSYSDILKSLDSESIAIEFIHAKNTGEIISLCLLPDEREPLLCFICNDKEIKALLDRNASIEEYNNLIWSNLAKYVKGKKNIFISPDGILNIIPIENYGRESNYFCSNSNIIRVSSTRMILSIVSKDINDFLLVGGLHYGKENTEHDFNDLPETSKEIGQISMLLEKQGIPYDIINGNEGTKDNIELNLQKSYSAVHLATHSFYWKENRTPNVLINKITNIINLSKHRTDKRLVRSGIILSSRANHSNKNDLEILSSYEIASLNLSKVNLVVLPNCKSGSGDITEDGIIGLQRAFKEAQTKTLLMSLWNADEIATRLLMVEFYKNYLSGKSLNQALHEAQVFLKNYKDEDGISLFEDPYYWAGFILLDAIE